MNLEIRNLQTQTEHLKKENNDLKSKAEIRKLPESTKTQPNIEKLNERIQEHSDKLLKALTYNSKIRTVTMSETPLRELKTI